MIEDEVKKLLEKEWSEEERKIIQKTTDGLFYYRKLLPSSLKADVIAALQLCNKLKDELEILKVSELQDIKTVKYQLEILTNKVCNLEDIAFINQ